MNEAVRRIRRRNCILEALELFRERYALVTVRPLIVFLYVCENEGLNVSELAHVSDMSVSVAARLARALLAPSAPDAMEPAAGLLEFRASPRDARIKFIHLTDQGRALRAELDQLIGQAAPIVIVA
jgi:DNA-binding MarR family transcriptional regulator